MNKKFYVPFETAKLLKENGYPQESDYVYCSEERREVSLAPYQMNIINAVAAPTYHEVIDWLIDKEYPIEVMWVREHSDLVWYCGVAHTITSNYSTREEALNKAILKVLEKL